MAKNVLPMSFILGTVIYKYTTQNQFGSEK